MTLIQIDTELPAPKPQPVRVCSSDGRKRSSVQGLRVTQTNLARFAQDANPSPSAAKVCAVGLLVAGMLGSSIAPVYADTIGSLLDPWQERFSSAQNKQTGLALVNPDALATWREKKLAEKAQRAEEEEILWLARTLFSETKISWEQRLVAWVVRNRVESPYYADTYKEVVLDPKQFSGLNDTDPNYWTNISIDQDTKHPAWQSALVIAEEVYYADDSERVLAHNVTHFYSPEAVRRHPEWAVGTTPVKSVTNAAGTYTRFAFYADVR